MKKTVIWIGTVIGAAAVMSLVFDAMRTTDTQKTISVVGECLTSAPKDKTAITLRVAALAQNAADSMRDATAQMADIVNYLKTQPVEIQTKQFNSYELKDFESVNVDLLAMVLSNNEGFTKECMDQIMNANDKIDEYPEIFNEHIEENEIEFYLDMYSCLFKKYECNMRNLERYAEMIRTKIETFAEE